MSEAERIVVVVKGGGEGCFLQTLNAGCAMLVMIPVGIVLFLMMIKACG